MLPPELSTDLTSLNPDVDRCAIIVEMKISDEGEFTLGDLYSGWVHNQRETGLQSHSGLARREYPF